MNLEGRTKLVMNAVKKRNNIVKTTKRKSKNIQMKTDKRHIYIYVPYVILK